MEIKKILYALVCVGGFAIAYVGLRVVGNALMGIGGIMLCIYGLLETMHAMSTSPAKKRQSSSMYSTIDPNVPGDATTCPNCGANVPDNNGFCGKCGYKMK